MSRPLLGRPSPRDWTHTGRIVLRGRKCWVPLTETLELAGVSSSFVVHRYDAEGLFAQPTQQCNKAL